MPCCFLLKLGSKHDDQEGVAQVHSVPEHTEDKTEKATENDKKESEQKESSNAAMTASSLFTSALDNLGFTSSASGPKDETVTATHEIQKEAESEAEGPNGNKGHHFAFFSTLGKVATDATQTIKDKVVSANMLSEFNKEQDLFIKSNKGKYTIRLFLSAFYKVGVTLSSTWNRGGSSTLGWVPKRERTSHEDPFLERRSEKLCSSSTLRSHLRVRVLIGVVDSPGLASRGPEASKDEV